MVLGGSGVGQITLHPILIRKVCQCILLTSDMEDLSLFVVTDNS